MTGNATGSAGDGSAGDHSVGHHSVGIDLSAPLIVGFGVTGQAVAAVLIERGYRPSVVDDAPGESARNAASSMEVDLITAPSAEALADAVERASVLLPSPGVPDAHPVFAAAASSGVPIRSEFDLAHLWDDRPIVAITGTNGKTSVTMLVTAALEASGLRAEAVGNTPTPLVAAIGDPDIDVFVVEASSFRLAHSHRFRPTVATWMNFAPDHLDAHADLETYRQAKASIWSHLGPDAIAVANVDDSVVMAARPADADVVTFGAATGDWRIEGDKIVGPGGPLISIDRLARRRPHDLSNAACAAATAMAAGATIEGVVSALEAFGGLPHRLAPVGVWDDVSWFNDSKATVPQATLAAVGGFESVVLIAGGRNKGLDMSELATTVPPVHTVVVTGDAADEIVSVFEPTDAIVVRAMSMSEAIERAAQATKPGDTVLLSPACTSFDWYDSYGQRGDDFVSLVTAKFTR